MQQPPAPCPWRGLAPLWPGDALPSLAPAAEAALLASIAPPRAPPPGAGAKRRRDESGKGPRRACFDFAKGACRFGSLCKFAHEAAADLPDGKRRVEAKHEAEGAARDLLRGLTDERARRVGAGGGPQQAEGSAGEAASADAEARAAVGAETGAEAGASADDAGDVADEGLGLGASALGAAEALPALSASTISPLTMVQRYYTRLFLPDGSPGPPQAHASLTLSASSAPLACRGEDHYVHLQSNRVCVVGLAPAHPAVRRGSPAVRVEFADVLSALAVTGKRKRGSVTVEPGRALARVTLADGRSYIVRACISARVLEVNEHLLREPQLLTQAPLTAGYVAILELQLRDVVTASRLLLDERRYGALLAARGLGVDGLPLISALASGDVVKDGVVAGR